MIALLHSIRRVFAALFFLALGCNAQAALPPGVSQGPSVEGITEYGLANGLRVLLFPDASQPKTTVNITYLVGSRMENYGETRLTHLLDHVVFKGTPSRGNIMEADRMVNSYISRKDLDSEMTVVRNEMERNETNPLRILVQRTMSAGFDC